MRPYPVCQPGGARRGALSPRRWDVFFDCMTKVLTRGDLARSPQFFALLDEDHTGSISKENLKSATRRGPEPHAFVDGLEKWSEGNS